MLALGAKLGDSSRLPGDRVDQRPEPGPDAPAVLRGGLVEPDRHLLVQAGHPPPGTDLRPSSIFRWIEP